MRVERPVQADVDDRAGVEHALVAQVVHGHDRARGVAEAAQVERHRGGLPVVQVEEIRRPADHAMGRRDGRAAQEREADRVVRVIAGRAAVHAVAIVERRAVEEELRHRAAIDQAQEPRGAVGRRHGHGDLEAGVLERRAARRRPLAHHPVERRHQGDGQRRIRGGQRRRQAGHHLAQSTGL